MWRYQSLRPYATPGRLDGPDDYLAFIRDHAPRLMADAQKGYADHGRGILLLRGPYGAYLRSSYVTATADDLPPYPASARADYVGYEPCHEMLVGVTDAAASSLRLWRISLCVVLP